MRHARCLLCVMLLCVATAADAQEKPLPDVQGAYTFKLDSDTLKPFAPDALTHQEAVATLERLNTLVRAAAVMAPPRGFDATATGGGWVDGTTCANPPCATSPVATHFSVLMRYFVEGSDQKPVASNEPAVALDVYTNAPYTSVRARDQLTAEGLTDVRGRMMYYQPARTGAFADFPLLDNNLVLLTKSKRMLWLPVTRENLLRSFIRDTEAKIARAGTDAAALEGLRSRLDRLKTELQAMPLTVRDTPAWHLPTQSPEESGLADTGAAGARPVVVVNPDFLDRTLPRGTVQLLTVHVTWGPHFDEQARGPAAITDADHVAVRRLWQLLNQLDWVKVGALVAEPKRR